MLRHLVHNDPGCVHFTSGGETALLAAVTNNAPLDVLEFLIAAGSDINATDGHGHTVLHSEVLNRPNDVARFTCLIDAGASLAARDHAGKTPLLSALVFDASFDVIKTLLDRGADLGAVDRNGVGALHHAVMHGTDEISSAPAIVSYLLASGADTSKLDRDGNTPLHYAVCGSYGNHDPTEDQPSLLAVIDMLLNAGVPRLATNRAGCSAHDIALKYGTLDPDALSVLGPRAKSAVL